MENLSFFVYVVVGFLFLVVMMNRVAKIMEQKKEIVRRKESRQWSENVLIEMSRLNTVDDVLEWVTVKVLNIRDRQNRNEISDAVFQQRYDILIDSAASFLQLQDDVKDIHIDFQNVGL